MQAMVREHSPIESLCLYRGRGDDGAPGQPIHAGMRFQGREEIVTLETSVTVPKTWIGGKVQAFFDIVDDDGDTHHGIEALVYVDGYPTQSFDRYHHALVLSQAARGGEIYNLSLVAYLGLGDNWGKRKTTPVNALLRGCELQRIDPVTEDLYYDIATALESAQDVD